MIDLVKRLRGYAQVAHMAAAWGFAGEGYTMEKAASRIEELEAEVEWLREGWAQSLDSLVFAQAELLVQAHIPEADDKILQRRIDLVRDVLAQPQQKGEE